MLDDLPPGLVQAILVLAPVILGLSIVAHRRLVRLVHEGAGAVIGFRQLRWNSCFIAGGAVFLFREALMRSAAGSLAQVCGLILAAEFIYVAYANAMVYMSAGGLLLGMSFSPWRRFSGHEWAQEGRLELRSRTGRRFRVRVPEGLRAQVQETVDLNILN